MSENNAETKKSIKKPLIIGISAFAAVAVIIAALIFAVSGEGIVKGVTVEGKPLAGMSVEEATVYIENNIKKEVPEQNVTVVFNGTEHQLSFEELVTEYDAAETAKIAYSIGRDDNPFVDTFEKIGLLLSNRNIPLEPVVNHALLDESVNEFCKTLDTMKVDDYCFIENDKLKLVFGTPGQFIDTDAFKLSVKECLRNGVDGKITLEAVYATPKEFDVDEIYAAIAKPPTNTYYEEVDGKKYVKFAQNGYDFDKAALKNAIDSNRGKCESFYFEPTVIKPESTEFDETGLFTEVLAKYTSKITDQDRNRLNNVHLAANKINGVIVNPDEIFSYLSYVEPITVAGGYKSANVYANGKIEKDIGGGVCQVSSALYSAVLNAHLEIVKRYAHSLTVAYVPYGQDATVASGEIDFRFKNNTSEPIKIVASSDNAGVYITLLGKKNDPSISVVIENVTTQTLVPEVITEVDETLQPGTEVVDYAGKTGYVVQTYKHIYKDGVYVETEHVSTSRYKKIDKTVRKGPDAEETGTEPTEGEISEVPPSEEVTAQPEENIVELHQPETVPESTEEQAVQR